MLHQLFLTAPKAPTSQKAGSVYAGYEISKTRPSDEVLMDRICQYWKIHWRTSPLCDDWQLYHDLKNISKSVWVDFGLMVGITYAESHIGTNFAPQHCSTTNNWSWKKRDSDGNKNWKEWCWLHQFDSVQSFWYSMATSLKRWYIDKSCDTAECISRRWVRWDGTLDGKHNRINRVNLFVIE